MTLKEILKIILSREQSYMHVYLQDLHIKITPEKQGIQLNSKNLEV